MSYVQGRGVKLVDVGRLYTFLAVSWIRITKRITKKTRDKRDYGRL